MKNTEQYLINIVRLTLHSPDGFHQLNSTINYNNVAPFDSQSYPSHGTRFRGTSDPWQVETPSTG